MSEYDDLLGAPPETNEYDSLLDSNLQQMRASVRGVINRNPDEAATDQKLATQTGIPAPVVSRNRPEVQRQAQLNDYDKLVDSNPKLSQFLTDSDNASVAHDDIANLSGLEWITTAFRTAHAAQWKQIELGTLRAKQLFSGDKAYGDFTPDDQARIERLKTEIGEPTDYGAEHWYSRMVTEAGALLPMFEKAAIEGGKLGALTAGSFGAVALAAGQAGPQVLTPEEVVTVPGAALTGWTIGSTTGAAKAMFDVGAGLAYDEFKGIKDENGAEIDDGVARGAAIMVGGVNAALQSFALGTAIKYVPGLRRVIPDVGQAAVKAALQKATFREAVKRFAKGYADTVGTGVTASVLQEATTILGEEVVKQLSPGDFKGLTPEQIADRISETAVRAAEGMAVIGAAGPATGFLRDAYRVHTAETNQAVFKSLGDLSKDSKLRQRLPEKFQEYVASLRDGANVTDVRIPVEQFDTYFQTQKLDPAAVAREVTGSDTAYTEAKAAGTDLVIPLDQYATKLAPTEHHAALMPDLRLHPDDMTLREAQAWHEHAASITSEMSKMEAPSEVSRPIYDDVVGQLLASGYERGAAEQNATLMASVFETLGKRTGTDPLELYQRYGLKIQNEQPDVLTKLSNIDVNVDPMIDRLRSGAVPTDREIYGASLSEFLKEKGGLQDQGGELANRDVRKSIPGLVKEDGLTLDHAAELAKEAGYLTDATPDALLEAVDRETSGRGAYRPNAQNQRLLDLRTALDDLHEFLGRQGIDLAQTDNAAVRKLLQSQRELSQRSAPSNQLDMFASGAIERMPEKPAEQPIGKPPERPAEPAPVAKPEAPKVEEVKPEEHFAELAPEDTGGGTTNDAGEQLWYNRRNFTGKGLSWDDVEGMNPTLRAKELTKTKIWSRPDYEKLTEEGLNPVAAHLVKQVYDSIATKPDTRGTPTDAQMKAYLEGVGNIREATIAFVRGIDMQAFGAALGKYAEAGGKSGYGYMERSDLSKVLGVVEDNRTNRHPLVDAIFPVPEGESPRTRFRGDSEQAKANNALALLLGGNKLLRALQLDSDSAIEAAKAVTQGWPAPQEAWQKRFSIMHVPAGERMYDKGAYRTLDKDEFFVVKKGTRRILSDGIGSREAAIERARDLTKREGGKQTGEEKLNVEGAQRKGVERRSAGKDVSSEELLSTFGFRGVNFGNWMKGDANAKERQLHLNHAYDSFADLADIMNLPPEAMSLNGMLGIAFGAQGRGGGAAAHFVPGVNEINLTREGGAGSLAHEWGHALDHYFNNQVGEAFAKRTDPFLTASGSVPQAAQGGLRPEILDAFRTIVKTMREREETPAERGARLEKSNADSLRRLDSWIEFFRKKFDERAKPEAKADALKKFEALAERMRAGDRGEYVKAGQGKGMNAYLHAVTAEVRELYKSATGKVPAPEELRGLDANVGSVGYGIEQKKADVEHKPMAVPSQYQRDARALDAGKSKGGAEYWSTPWEMFARAFESYVMDTLKDKAARNDYLVSPAKDPKVQEAMVKLGLREANPYPAGEDRTAINAAFDNLVRNIKSEPTDKGVRLYQSAAHLTDTPAFKQWFRDSKLVDEKGEPLVLYHGTTDSFDQFDLDHPNRKDTGWLGTGVYATTNSRTAGSYSLLKDGRSAPNVMPLYARLENPFHATQRDKERLQLISHSKGAEAGRAAADEWTRELKAKGYDGVILDYKAREVGDASAGREVVVFDPAGVKSAVGNRGTFDPNSPNILSQNFEETRRGSISFGPNRQFNIALLKDRDLSTFLHESGHFYLEVLGDLAEGQSAPTQIVQDYAAILKWLGVETRQAIDTKHHEQFARGFEAYLMEGKAPNVALQGAFARFRAWLVSIYRKMGALHVELSDEVRGVFDRLVATDDAIRGAEESQNYRPIFATAEAAGMTPEQFAAYRGTVESARAQAEDDLSRKLLDVKTREQKAWWKEQRAKVLGEVAGEVHGMRTYRALSFLQRGTAPDGTPLEGVTPVKLDKAALMRELGLPQEFLNRLPGAGKSKIYALEGGAHPDVVAAMFGYRGAAEMIQELVNARPMHELIKAETDARMRERYPDPLVDGSLADTAIQAVHSGKRAELLAAEMRALRRKEREVKPFVSATERGAARERAQSLEANRAQMPGRDDVKIIRAAAEQTIARKVVRDIQPGSYRTAEAKAARRAFDAATKGDFETAYFEKRRQLLNHELFTAASNALDESERIREYFKRFGKKAVRERIGKAGGGELAWIDTLLSEFSLSRMSGTQLDQLSRKRAVLNLIDDGELLAEPELREQLQKDTLKNWREMPFEVLSGLRDGIKQLEHRAIEISNAVVNGEKVNIEDTARAVADSITAGNKAVALTVGTRGPMEAGKRGAKQALLSWLRPAAIARQLDGGADFGPTLRHVIEPIRRAYAEKLIPMDHKIREDVAQLYRKAFTNDELSGLNKRLNLPELGLEMTRGDLLSLALNWGNDGNREALLKSTFEGRKLYTAEGIGTALSRLTDREWAFVQSVWDYVDTYWPQIEALERRRRGVAPKKVEAKAFSVRREDGSTVPVKGGYYPLKYDPALSALQRADDVEAEFKRLTQGRPMASVTRAGSTIERVGSGGRAVRLGLGVIDEHLHEIARDISLGDETRFVSRVLNHPALRTAMAKTGNLDAHETLKLWLQDAAVGEMAARGFLAKASGFLRTGFTASKLAWNVGVTILQVVGLPQTAVVTGPKAFAQGLGRFVASPVKAHRMIMESSAFMRSRYQTGSFNKDIADTHAYLDQHFVLPTRAAAATKMIAHSFYWPIARAQMLVDDITWLAGYSKGIEQRALAEKDAAVYADSVVENAQTSGFFVDRSAVERGTLDSIQHRQSQFVKLWTTLISYMLAKGNIAYEKGRAFSRKPTLWGATALAGDMVMLYAIDAIASGLLRGQAPSGDDDKQGWASWIASQAASSAVSGVPFIREIPSAAYGGGNTPIGGLANDFYKALVQTEQGEVDPAAIKAWNNVGGTLFHYPSSQINRAVDAYWADSQGEDVAPYEYLTGHPKKRN